MAYCTQSGRWDIDFNRSMGTLESFPIKISLHFWSYAGQPLFYVHALLITVACVSVTLFSEKIQACSKHSRLISPDGRLLKGRTVALFGTCPVVVRSPVPPGVLGVSVGLSPPSLVCVIGFPLSLASCSHEPVLMVQNSSLLPWVSSFCWTLWLIPRSHLSSFLLAPFRSLHFW